jgi:hypothetical protein
MSFSTCGNNIKDLTCHHDCYSKVKVAVPTSPRAKSRVLRQNLNLCAVVVGAQSTKHLIFRRAVLAFAGLCVWGTERLDAMNPFFPDKAITRAVRTQFA